MRYLDFEASQAKLMASSAAGAAGELVVSLHELRRSVRLFAESQTGVIETLVARPDDMALHEKLGQAVHASFPEAFAFTIADRAGPALLKDFDGLVGEICQQDLRRYAADSRQNRIYIHPNPLVYHYDIRVDWAGNRGAHGIFFVSLSADALPRVLRNSQVSGHKLLLNKDVPGLIEVSEGGARIKLKREFKLSAQEMRRIGYRVAIAGHGMEPH